MNNKIWYNKFTDGWMNALPLGNGKTAAMVYGNPNTERAEINEESLWAGRRIEEKYGASKGLLDKMRNLLFEGRNEEAQAIARENFLSTPAVIRSFQSMGEVIIDFADHQDCWNYHKELDLSDGIFRVSYTKKATEYSGESFVSEKHNVFVYKMSVNEGKTFSCTIKMERGRDAYTSGYNNETIIMNGQLISCDDARRGPHSEDMRFAAMLRVQTDGKTTLSQNAIKVEDATYFIVFSAYGTNYNVKKYDIDESIDFKSVIEASVNDAIADGYDKIKNEHIKTHKSEFEKVSLNINDESKDNIPTDTRTQMIKAGEVDNSYYVLYFNFGRYLLLCSSGKLATLPANLQGIWCNGYAPPWNSDYHTNINIQMNYWPALPLNMSNTMKPYEHFMKMISMAGEDTARKLYDAKGWVIHHTTDIFARTGIHDSGDVGFFPMAAPWLCLNLWEKFEFENDIEFLKDCYPIFKGACEFLLDFLIEDKDGNLVTNPSNSPENKFYYELEGEVKSSFFTYGATIDFEIIYAIFTRMIYACELLGKDAELADQMKLTLSKLPPLKISNRYGTICEWIEDYEEVEIGHRHISHLFGLYPADQINETNPEIFEAAKKTIERRISHGGGATGWSRAWIINFYARLKDGNAALDNLKCLMSKSTAENLFDMHPPFQIDGNFGSIAGISEMLLQSHLGEPGARIIEFLPSLPDDWKSGSINGIKARGNFEISLNWTDGKMTFANVKALCENDFRFKQNQRSIFASADLHFAEENGIISIHMEKDESITINFK